MKLKENTSYLQLRAKETGLGLDQLEMIWNDCVNKQKIKNPNIKEEDPQFIKNVMKDYDKIIDDLHIEKAKGIIMAREDNIRHGQDWVNSMAENNYIKANEVFPKFVKSCFEKMVDTKSKEFLNQFSEKLKKNK